MSLPAVVMRKRGWVQGLMLCVLGLLLAVPFGALAREALQVQLETPSEVRGLLEQHLRILNREQLVPEERGDRIALIRRTRREVEGILATEGYFSPEVALEREGTRWMLKVAPGQRAKVTAHNLKFTGHLAGEEATLKARREVLAKSWSLRAGEFFRQADWDAAKQTLLDEVASRDYAAARVVDSRAAVNRQAGEVVLHLTIDSGPPFRLGPIQVSGLKQLPEGFVERFSPLREGESFDQDRLLGFQSTLQNVPQFASVVIDVARDPALAEAVPVLVNVSEADSRYLSFGAGYSTNTGARAEMNWRDLNLRNRGWELSSGLRWEQRRQSAYADLFFPPAYEGHRDSVGMLFDRSDIEGLDTSVQAIGLTRTKPRGDIETTITLRYQHETLRPAGLAQTSRNALTANWAWVQRKVDNVLDPRSGYVLHVELGGGAKSLLSDQDFIRSYGRLVRYQPVGQRDVLILRGELGTTLADSRDGVPQDFLFRTGGSQTVRGYAFNSLGVREGEATLGGRYMGVASAEYVHWFKPNWGVAGFADVGDAADEYSDLDFRLGYGLGARWRSPAGPLALDLAYGHHDSRLRIHFAIGIAF